MVMTRDDPAENMVKSWMGCPYFSWGFYEFKWVIWAFPEMGVALVIHLVRWNFRKKSTIQLSENPPWKKNSISCWDDHHQKLLDLSSPFNKFHISKVPQIAVNMLSKQIRYPLVISHSYLGSHSPFTDDFPSDINLH